MAFGDITGHRHQCQQNASGREAPKQNDGKTFFTTRLAGQKYFILSLVSQVALWNLNEGTNRDFYHFPLSISNSSKASSKL